MSVPKSVTRFSKDGITYVSSVDRVQYTIKELTRAALRDVGKFVAMTCNKESAKRKGWRHFKYKGRIRGKKSAFQFWERKKECDLLVGIKHDTWYGIKQELGSDGQPEKGLLYNIVHDNIPTIVEIESKYLSALEDEAKALSLLPDEDDIIDGGGDDE